MKKCSKCLRSKELSKFNRRARSRDGLNTACRECTKARSRKYLVSALGRKTRTKYRKEVAEVRDKKKLHARRKVKEALKDGRLVRQSCMNCDDKLSHAHHQDYERPLEVIWLCAICHRSVHMDNSHLYRGNIRTPGVEAIQV